MVYHPHRSLLSVSRCRANIPVLCGALDPVVVEPLYGVAVGEPEERPGGRLELWVELRDEGGGGGVGQEGGDGFADLGEKKG